VRKITAFTSFSGVSLMALTLASHPASAQASPTNASTLDDIVVTARRVEERLQDVPISITVLSQQQLTNRNVVTAGDIATYTPSLSANSRWGAESTSYAIRGFVQEGPTSPSVAVYFADVVAPRANGGTTAGNGAGVGSFFDLQNVQVLKGPQGTLFGRNTTGGAVLLVPQKPTPELEGYLEGTLGNYDRRRLQAVVNVPLGDNLRMRLGIDRQKRDGTLKNISGIGPRDFDDTDYTALRFSMVADLSANLENYTIATYSKSDTNGSFPKMFALAPARDTAIGRPIHAAQFAATSDADYIVANGNPLAGQQIEQWQVINTTSWSASDAITIKNIASYGQFRQAQTTNNNGDNGYQSGSANPYYSIAVFTAPGSHNASQQTLTEELQLQGSGLNDRLHYQVGAYYEWSNPLGGFQTTYSPQNINCTDVINFQCSNLSGRGLLQFSASKYRFRNLGLYAQGTYKLTDTLSVTGGFRYTSDKASGEGRTRRILFPTPNTPLYTCAQPTGLVTGGTSAEIQADPSRCSLKRRVSSKKPTWLIDFDYKPNDDILLYAKYARGYRQGSLNVSSYGLETWQPEKVDLYEIGAKTSFHGPVRGTFNIAGFYNDFSNQQLLIGILGCTAIGTPQCPFIASAGQGIANAGKSSIKGVEMDLSLTLFEGFNLDVGYAYLDSKLKSLTSLPAIPPGFTTLIPPAVGGPLPLTPKNKYTVTASYTLPLDESLGKVILAATFTHQDKTYGNSSSAPENQFLPPQDLLNLNLNWNAVGGTPVDVGLFATNVTKERFFLYTTGQSFGYDSAILNEPRMYGLRVKYHFGG
jgi:iron complex outermembrane receptor protein